MKIKNAFTLAETLTTLMLVGVVSAVTIPVLMSDISKQKNIAMLKKLYASFSVNIQTVLNEANCESIACLRRYNRTGNDRTHNGVFADTRFMKISKVCPSENNPCWNANDTTLPGGSGENSYPNINNGDTNFTTYLLDNGASMSLFDFPGNCNNQGSVSVRGNSLEACGIVIFDTNHLQAPNFPGKDRFMYFILNEPYNDSYLFPAGYNDAVYGISMVTRDGECVLEDKSTTYDCTARVMKNNWKIDY